eukprot:1150703-Pelagomonas_calceolata.AAC.3
MSEYEFKLTTLSFQPRTILRTDTQLQKAGLRILLNDVTAPEFPAAPWIWCLQMPYGDRCLHDARFIDCEKWNISNNQLSQIANFLKEAGNARQRGFPEETARLPRKLVEKLIFEAHLMRQGGDPLKVCERYVFFKKAADAYREPSSWDEGPRRAELVSDSMPSVLNESPRKIYQGVRASPFERKERNDPAQATNAAARIKGRFKNGVILSKWYEPAEHGMALSMDALCRLQVQAHLFNIAQQSVECGDGLD